MQVSGGICGGGDGGDGGDMVNGSDKSRDVNRHVGDDAVAAVNDDDDVENHY